MHGLLELSASTLCSLSQRQAAHPLLLATGAVPALISLLPPTHTACTVVNACSALGNLAADAPCRRAVRSQGGVGALVRLLRADAPSAMQAAAASAVCLLAARDPIIQDSVRYLGGIELLVDLLVAPRASVAKVARCAWFVFVSVLPSFVHGLEGAYGVRWFCVPSPQPRPAHK